MKENSAKTIDEYILNAGPELVEILIELKICIKNGCPEATESISYGMPAFKYLNKNPCVILAYLKHKSVFFRRQAE
jgi:uncharacterized protein YdhG (YjbR/CyaY superfamily)